MSHDLPVADVVFDGGAMDCGSGLILLIRQHMLQVPDGGILEIRSSEPTVADELPPWCRMVGHELVQSRMTEPGRWRHWVRRTASHEKESAALSKDLDQAAGYSWQVRGRLSGVSEWSIYARNFSWKIGQGASFAEKDRLPSAIEAFLGAILAEVLDGFAMVCSRNSLNLDELEGSIRATLLDPLIRLGAAEGDPALGEAILQVYVTAPASAETLRVLWSDALRRSPLWRTLGKACKVEGRLTVI